MRTMESPRMNERRGWIARHKVVAAAGAALLTGACTGGNTGIGSPDTGSGGAAKSETTKAGPVAQPTGRPNVKCVTHANVDGHTVRVSTVFEGVPNGAAVVSNYLLQPDGVPPIRHDPKPGEDGDIFTDVPGGTFAVTNDPKVNGYDYFCKSDTGHIEGAVFQKLRAARPDLAATMLPYQGVPIQLAGELALAAA